MPDPTRAEAPLRRSSAERAALGFVLLACLGMFVAVLVFIATYATRIPCADDTALFLMRARPLALGEYLWGLHNEHRLPVPKLVQLGLYSLTGDIRSGMYAQAVVYAAIALACILVARRLRGGSRPWDAFFPLMWLQLGNSENLLMGFQLCIALPCAAVCTILFLGVLSPRRLSPAHALACGLALFVLPLCGGAGILQAPALGAWLFWLGWSERRHPEPNARRGARILVVSALATALVCVVYVIGFRAPPGAEYTLSPRALGEFALGTLTLAFGPAYSGAWPLSGFAVVAVSGALVLILVRRTRATRAADRVASGTLAVLAAGICLALGIAYGRPNHTELALANRYLPLPAPYFVALSLGALVLIAGRAREFVLALCCVAMGAASVESIRYGIETGNIQRSAGLELDALVAEGAPRERIHALYTRNFLLGQSEVASWVLQYYAAHALPPFDRGADYSRARFNYPSFDTVPIGVEYKREPAPRTLDGENVFCVAPETTLRFACTATQHALSGFLGAPDQTVAEGTHPGIRVRAFLIEEQGARRALGQREYDPVRDPAARGMQRFEFRWEPGAAGTLVLHFDPVDASESGLARGWIKLRGLRVE